MIVLGTISYMGFEKWGFIDSLYMTVMTITSIGSQEIKPLSIQGKIFTIIYSLIGFLTMAGSIGILSSALIEGHILGVYKRRKKMRKIEKLKNHLIICGVGDIANHVIREVIRANKDFVLIDEAPKIKAFKEEMSYIGIGKDLEKLLIIEGDPSKEDVLLSAGLSNAKGLLSCMQEDAQNLFICLSAKNLNPLIRLSTYVIEEENTPKFFLIGVDDVVSGNFIIGKRIAYAMLQENVQSFLDQVTFIGQKAFFLGEVEIKEQSFLIGKTLKESNISNATGLLVFSIKKFNQSDFIFNPNSNILLEQGDILIVLGSDEDVKKLSTYVNGEDH